MSWFLAPSLRALFGEVNQIAPRRNKTSDGSIGDASHQARRSDHNPDRSAGGVVRAIDVTHDPGGGCDCNQLAGKVRERRDPRVAYIIWNRRIMSGQSGPRPWVWCRYTGPNPHDHHMHVSIQHTRAAETNVGTWLGGHAVTLGPGPVNPIKNKPIGVDMQIIRADNHGPLVLVVGNHRTNIDNPQRTALIKQGVPELNLTADPHLYDALVKKLDG